MNTFRQRQIEITEFSFADCPEDSFIQSAYWADDGKELTDDEMDELNTHRSDIAQDAWFERQGELSDRAFDEAKEFTGPTYMQKMEEEARDAYINLK